MALPLDKQPLFCPTAVQKYLLHRIYCSKASSVGCVIVWQIEKGRKLDRHFVLNLHPPGLCLGFHFSIKNT